MPVIKIHGKTLELDAPLTGAKAIAQVRNQTPRQVFNAASEGRFAFRKDGKLIVTTAREALLPLVGPEGIERLIVAEPHSTSKAA
jgi:hypothetical protein